MASFTLWPNADTAVGTIQRSTGAVNYTLVDEVTANTTDYVFSSGSSLVTNTKNCTFGFPNTAVTGTISAVTLYCRAAGAHANARGTITLTTKVGANEQNSSTIDVATAAGAYVTHERKFLTNPTGGSWSWSDIDSLEYKLTIAAYATDTSTRQTRVTQIYVGVEYDVSATPTTRVSILNCIIG